MDYADVYNYDLARTGSSNPDRQGLFDALQSHVANAPKAVRILPVQAESMLQGYLPKLKDFASKVDVAFGLDGYKIIVSQDIEPTYRDLKFGSSWFDLNGDVDALIIAKIFWASGT